MSTKNAHEPQQSKGNANLEVNGHLNLWGIVLQ